MRLYTHTHTHTLCLLDNKKEINKICKRDICTSASNCGVHKINSNCKITNEKMQTSDPSCRVKDIFFLHDFERKMLHPRGSANIFKLNKIESNTVGADASVRPQNKNDIKIFGKIKSNNLTSNLKPQTSNSAITLIALIITIIVLLILAGVTLNMMMGENGIINKAQLAKEKTNKAQEDEKIKIKELEDELNNYNTRGNETVEDYTDDLIYKLNLNNLQSQQGVTVNGNVVVSSDNKYATFDGNSYINVANNTIDPNSNLRTEQNVSLCCWYRTTESKNAVFMEYGENTTSNIYNVHFLFNKESNIAAGQGFATCDRLINPSNRYDGKWHFVVAIYENNDTVTLYYDGVPFQAKGSYSASNSYLNIGGVSDAMSTWGYIGDLSDIRIYKNGLSEEKVKQLFEYGKQELGI